MPSQRNFIHDNGTDTVRVWFQFDESGKQNRLLEVKYDGEDKYLSYCMGVSEEETSTLETLYDEIDNENAEEVLDDKNDFDRGARPPKPVLHP